VTRRSWQFEPTDDETVRIRWIREDGVWVEIRADREGARYWVVDASGFKARVSDLREALDTAYRRQAQLDGFGMT